MCLSPQVDHGLQHDQHEQQRNQVLNLQDRHDRGAEQYGQVSLSLGLIENPSVSCAEVGCVLQTLEDQVPAIRAETVPAQRSQRERMGRVVGQVELTFQAQFTPLSISETLLARSQQTIEFSSRWLLLMQLPNARQIAKLLQAHCSDPISISYSPSNTAFKNGLPSARRRLNSSMV